MHLEARAGDQQPGPELSANAHGQSADEVLAVLGAHPETGLPPDEAAARQVRHGPNELPRTAGEGALRRLARQFQHPLVVVLLVASAVTLALGELVDSAVILAVVLVNAAIGHLQESKAEAALEALRSLTSSRARVVRGGQHLDVEAAELVPGDLVRVEAGDRVPADLRVVQAVELAADESALTGESLPVSKSEAALPVATVVADRRNVLHSGTLLTAGSGTGVVVATGAHTQLGDVHRLVGEAEVLATPLTRKLNDFSRLLTAVILVLAAVAFAVGMLQGRPVSETFTAAVALAVGAIPEGLPAAVTITLAIGVRRMAHRRAVVRRLPAVETLGSTTVICSDKTGTLTENQMTVSRVWTPDAEFAVSGSGYAASGDVRLADGRSVSLEGQPALRWSLTAGAGCNDAAVTEVDGRPQVVGDPTEAAMLVVAAKAGLGQEQVAQRLPRVATTAFSSERQYMATVHRDGDAGGHVVLVKGSVERLLELCDQEMSADGTLRPIDRAAAQRAAERLAEDGLRVLGTALARVVAAEAAGEEQLRGALVLTGLQAMLDPPRSAAAAAVRSCQEAGVAVKMITGDHAVTATAIARRLGLLDGPPTEGQVLVGQQLAELPADLLPAAVDEAVVLARVTPEQKLRLVEALQSRRHVVAMTGDGVNDAPALRRADIGIAMGRSGTEVAQQASDMVLTDDDFASIAAAVEEGRGVFDNLTKFIVWTLPTNMGEGAVVLVALLAGGVLPILPTQILWINMTTAVALGLMLAFEPKEPGIMTREPRHPDRPLLTRALALRILLVSALLVAGSWWLFSYEVAAGASLPEARTAAVNVFVAVQVLYLFSCRSATRPAWRLGVLSNPWILGGVAAQAVGQLLLTYSPFFNSVFQTAPLSAATWLRVLAVAVLTWVVIGIDKRLRAGAA